MTDPARATIALVFDFDDTLAPDSTSAVLEAAGIDPPSFWARHRELMAGGWDQVPAYMQMMLEASRERGGAITRDLIEKVGRRLAFFRGVRSMFKRYKGLICRGHCRTLVLPARATEHGGLLLTPRRRRFGAAQPAVVRGRCLPGVRATVGLTNSDQPSSPD